MKRQILTTVLWLGLGAWSAHGNETTFTYQGELTDTGTPADGLCDVELVLYDAAAGGNNLGADSNSNVPVQDGRFTVSVDFGPAAFPGSDRWLEIRVRYPAGVGGFTTLSPRQPITRAPYSVATRGLSVNALNTFVGIGRTDPITGAERFGIHSDVANGFGGMYASTTGQGARPFYGYAAGADVDAYHYFDGTTSKWHLYNSGTHLTVTDGGFVGVRTSSPSYPFHLPSSGTEYAMVVSNATLGGKGIFGEATNSSGVGFGVVGESHASGGKGVWGVALSTSTAGGSHGVFGDAFSATGTGVLGRARAQTGSPVGVKGICVSPAGYDFFASGAGTDYGSTSSRRWKRNVEPIEEPLEKVLALRGVTFDWDEEHGGHHDIGMIAEETGEVLPEIVAYEENGVDAIGMDYSRLTPLLVEAVKALIAQNERMAQQLSALEAARDAQVAALQGKLAAYAPEQ